MPTGLFKALNVVRLQTGTNSDAFNPNDSMLKHR